MDISAKIFLGNRNVCFIITQFFPVILAAAKIHGGCQSSPLANVEDSRTQFLEIIIMKETGKLHGVVFPGVVSFFRNEPVMPRVRIVYPQLEPASLHDKS